MQLTPQQALITDGNSNDYERHIQATLAADRSFALIYSAGDAAYAVDLSHLAGKRFKAAWYNPRTDDYHRLKKSIKQKDKPVVRFDPPGESGPGNDWILLIGDRSFERRVLRLVLHARP